MLCEEGKHESDFEKQLREGRVRRPGSIENKVHLGSHAPIFLVISQNIEETKKLQRVRTASCV